MDLFSFGTLMDPDLLTIVCGQDLNTLNLEPATVDNQIPLWVLEDHYPVLVPRHGAHTNGMIIRKLCAKALDRIIFFEGGEFSIQTIEVTNADNVLESVQYFKSTETKEISDQVWQLEDWQRDTKADTMPRVLRYMQCYGKMSVDEADAYW